jgi:hypothetical protein
MLIWNGDQFTELAKLIIDRTLDLSARKSHDVAMLSVNILP